MGRRSRQRDAAAGAPSARRPDVAARPTPPAPPATPRLRARREELPKAPWHPFPLVELAVLVGLIALVAGFVSDGSRRSVLVTTGVLLCTLAGLDQVVREHFAGYRSHTTVLTLAAFLLVGAPVGYFTIRLIGIIAGVAAAAAAYAALRAAFARRAGGLTWRA